MPARHFSHSWKLAFQTVGENGTCLTILPTAQAEGTFIFGEKKGPFAGFGWVLSWGWGWGFTYALALVEVESSEQC